MDLIKEIQKRNKFNNINNINNIKNIIEQKIDVDATDNENDTALTWACYLRNYDSAAYLLDRRANISHIGIHGLTPIMQCFWNPTINLCYHNPHFVYDTNEITNLSTLLIKQKANINDTIYGRSILMYVCQSSNNNLIKYLLNNGAHPNIIGYQNETAIQITNMMGNSDGFLELLRKGADLNTYSITLNDILSGILLTTCEHCRKQMSRNIPEKLVLHQEIAKDYFLNLLCSVNLEEKGIYNIIVDYLVFYIVPLKKQ